MTKNNVPHHFIWTKVQAEAGQSLNLIFNRKELERQSGGTFWWGIGESKAEQIKLLLAIDPTPQVLFSRMLSVPHKRDSDPDSVLLWEAYKTIRGDIPLPLHVVTTSRAHDQKGNLKRRHYALVCTSPTVLMHSGGNGALRTNTLRNFGERGKPIGASQVTAVVSCATHHDCGRTYPITARAMLAAPFAVQLTSPRMLSEPETRLLNSAVEAGTTAEDWIKIAKQLRKT